MKIIQILQYRFNKEDFGFIVGQIKAKKLKVKDIAKECGLSRAYFYDVLKGKCPCPERILNVLKDHKIVIPYCDFYYGEI